MKQETVTLRKLTLEPADLRALHKGVDLQFTIGGERVSLVLSRGASENGNGHKAAPKLDALGRRNTPAAQRARSANAKKARAAMQKILATRRKTAR